MKNRRMFSHRMSIFLSSLLAYIIILSVPTIIGIGIYTQSIRVIHKEVNRANEAILKQVQLSFDSRLREVEQLAVKIGLDSRINGLISVKTDIQVTHRYTMHEIINDFGAYIVASQFIHSFYVYMENSDIAIASNAAYDSHTLVTTWHGKGEEAYDEWKDMINNVHTKRYLMLDRVNGKDTNQLISFAQPLPIGSPKDHSAMLVIFLNESILREIISNIRIVNQGVVMVVNSNGETLFSTEPFELPSNLGYEELSQAAEPIPEKIDGENVMISCIRSSVADWVYITAVPTEVFMQEAINARRMALIGLAICMILGGALVAYFIRMNYNPVQELIRTITRKSGLSMARGLNEYNFIQDVVSRIIDEKDDIQKRLKQQNQNLKNYHLAKVLKGGADNIPFENTCQFYNLDMKNDWFAVMLFYIEGYSHQMWKDSAVVNSMIYDILSNMMGTLSRQYEHEGVIIEVDNFYACLINLCDDKDAKTDMLAIAENSVQLAADNFGLHFSVSVSDCMKSPSGIPILYQHALETIEYLLLIGKSGVLHYDEIKAAREAPLLNRDFILEEKKFVNYLRAGDYEKAKEFFNEIIVHNFLSDPYMSIELVKCRMFGLVNTTINALGELRALYKSKFFEREKPFERLLNCHSIQDLQQCFNELLDEVAKLDPGQTAEDPELIDKVDDFIHLNYQDVNLNVSMAADYFGITTANLSKQFKKRSGIGLLAYIHRYRVNKTKELLENTQSSVSDIAKMAGFINSDALIRVFKQYEGITPGKYRDVLANLHKGKK